MPVTEVALWQRRVLARMLDAVWQLPLAVAAFLAIDSQDGQPGWLAWAAAAATAMLVQVCGEALLTWMFGSTPGKAATGLALIAGDGSRTPAARVLILRALKVGLWGYGGWIPPAGAAAALLNVRRLKKGAPLPWERGEARTEVARLAAGAMRVGSAWGVALCLPLLAASAWVVLTQDRDALRSTLSTQALSRSISGQWTWLNLLSGTIHTLDSAWRLEQENFYPGKSYTAVFAQGEGGDVSLTFRVYWRPSTLEPSCVLAQATVEDYTYIATTRTEKASAERLDCEIHGGTLAGGKPLRKSTKASYFPASGVYFLLVSTYPIGNDEAKEQVEDLASAMSREVGRGDFERGRLKSYFWRNDITGKVASVPSTWELYSLGLAGDASVLAFVKWGPRDGEFAGRSVLRCQPRYRGDDWRRASAAQFADGTWFGQFVWEPRGDPELSYYLLDNKQVRGRAVFLEGKTCGWTVIWENAEQRDVAHRIDEHELMRSLVATLH